MPVKDPDEILATELESHHDDVAILRVAGEIDLSSAPILAKELKLIASGHFRDVVIDATAVTFMDSTGLHALVEGKKAIHQNGMRIYLIPSPQVKRVLDLVFPDRLFAARLDSVAEALSAIESASPS